MLKISWNGGAALLRMTTEGRCDWAYCGGGPIFRDVRTSHFVAAIESLLGWDHPAARDANAFIRNAK
jgi:hypothetical protein